MVLIVVTQSPAQAATYKEVPKMSQDGYDFWMLNSNWGGLLIGDYCFVEVGQRITPNYSALGFTNMSYYTTSGSAISISKRMDKLPNVGGKARIMTLKKPSELHMAHNADVVWRIERVDPISYEYYLGPGYSTEYKTETVANYKITPSINYYGLNYDLDAGNWVNKSDWIETIDGIDYGIWKSTGEQYTEDGSLYEGNIWFAYDGFEVVLPEIADVEKEGYELKGWGTVTGSAIEVNPGCNYILSNSNAENRTEWSQENINIKALWEPKNIGAQEVNRITLNEATLTADYEAYYDITDKGFMYKKSSDSEWIDVKAVEQNGKLTATITGLDIATSYDVKGYFENQTGRIENEITSFRTHRPQSVGEVTVNNITSDGAAFHTSYVSDDELLEKGFKYKKSSDADWNTVSATISGNELTANVSKLAENTRYEVKAYIKTIAGETEGEVITYTTPMNSSGNSGSGSSGGSSGNGSSGVSVSSPPATTTTIAVTTNTESTSPSVTSTTTTEAKSDSNGKASATVTKSQVSEAVNKAVDEASKQGKDTIAKVEIKITTPADAKTVETSLPKAAMTEVADSKTDTLSVVTPEITIAFDKAAIATIAKEAKADVKITTSKVDTAGLSKEVKAVIGDRPVFNFSVTSGDKSISQFGGTVTVSVTYAPKKGEDTNAIIIYYINDKGKAEIVKDCVYDKGTGRITFKTNHFSKFAVGYNKTNFKDVAETAGYSDAVSYLTARGIMKGTGKGKFSPNNKITRGELLVMVMESYGIEPVSGSNDNYTDAGNAYYTNYLATAKKLGINAGVKNNKFAPNKKLTRQEMAYLLYDILKKIDQLPSDTTDKTLTDYSDAEQIAKWAKEPMALFVQTGILRGSDGKLKPKDNANRALMAQALYELLTK